MSITLKLTKITGGTNVECATLDLEEVGLNLCKWCYQKSQQFCNNTTTLVSLINSSESKYKTAFLILHFFKREDTNYNEAFDI